ncbi:unnamed protein product [Acanthosepion pharaonis]|uniref:PH domain-containing protein n=1 Tax=Acanthosepion pharaonis TaxID=158019 RepID=A0A812DNH2_ACAPH|nr:unnamed protein product [Sepia pharaonis]
MNRLDKSPQIKAGLVTHLHHFLLSKSWKERYLVLLQDSTLEWYSDDRTGSLEGSVNLKFVAPLLSIGERTKNIPGKPKLPGLTEDRLLMAVPDKPTKDCNIEWFLFADENDVQSWVEAIQFVLRPFQQDNQSMPSAPPPPYSPPLNQPGYPSYPGYNLTQPATLGNYPGIPYPQQVQSTTLNYNMVPYPTGSAVPQKETIIIREEDRSGDNFAAGFLMGEAATLNIGHGWGDSCYDCPNVPPNVIQNTEINIFEEPYDNDFNF